MLSYLTELRGGDILRTTPVVSHLFWNTHGGKELFARVLSDPTRFRHGALTGLLVEVDIQTHAEDMRGGYLVVWLSEGRWQSGIFASASFPDIGSLALNFAPQWHATVLLTQGGRWGVEQWVWFTDAEQENCPWYLLQRLHPAPVPSELPGPHRLLLGVRTERLHIVQAIATR